MRRPIIAGNWKLNNNRSEAKQLVEGIVNGTKDVSDVDMVVCPVYTSLETVQTVISDSTVKLGAQNVYWETSGAFTGEVSSEMLKDVGCEFVIIGHSERRQYFGETNETVNQKIKAVLAAGLTPIVCVGETLPEREADKVSEVVGGHVRGGLKGFSADEIGKMVIAYEPVWAIGTGKTATPEQAQEVHKLIRDILVELAGDDVAQKVRIQYGGSVKPDNVKELMAKADIDGALVGGASLKADSFISLVKFNN